METTLDRVRRHVASDLSVNPSDVTAETSLYSDLNVDSLTMVELVMHLEEEFGIELDDDEALGLRTVQQIVDYVDRLRTAVPAAG